MVMMIDDDGQPLAEFSSKFTLSNATLHNSMMPMKVLKECWIDNDSLYDDDDGGYY